MPSGHKMIYRFRHETCGELTQNDQMDSVRPDLVPTCTSYLKLVPERDLNWGGEWGWVEVRRGLISCFPLLLNFYEAI